MKEFTITVVVDRSDFLEQIGRTPAGPQNMMGAPDKSEVEKSYIKEITLTARLVDVEYSEVQSLLEKMKEDARKR
jgi:hypothetical protein